MITIRPAQGRDAAFREDMLVEAINWDQTIPRRRRDEVLGHHSNRHYVAGWPRPSDVGFIAEDPEKAPVGAAWLRFFSEEDPGYGFVAGDVPEISIAVVPERLGQGIGDRLLRELEDHARRRGIRALSLSVEPKNRARRLHERHGFRRVGGSGGADTLELRL